VSEEQVHDQHDVVENEVSLVDIGRVVVRRKKVFFVIFILCLLIGIVHSFFMTPVYKYQQDIKLATYFENGKLKSLQDSQTVLDLLQQVYIPNVVMKFNDQNKKLQHLSVTAFQANLLNKNNNLAQLSVVGPLSDASTYSQLFNKILSELIKEEKTIIQGQYDYLQDQVNINEQNLKNVKQHDHYINDTFDNFTKNVSLYIAKLQDNKNDAHLSTSNNLLTALLLSNSLGQKPADSLYTAQVALLDKMHNNSQQEADLAAKMIDLKSTLKSLKTSSFISEIQYSDKPIGLSSKKGILAIAVLLGVILGLLGVFVTELFLKIKQKKADE